MANRYGFVQKANLARVRETILAAAVCSVEMSAFSRNEKMSWKGLIEILSNLLLEEIQEDKTKLHSAKRNVYPRTDCTCLMSVCS